MNSKILAIAEIQGEIENLLQIVKAIKEHENFDYVVCVGDFLSNEIIKGYSEEEIAEIIIEILKKLSNKLITVPGNNDGKIIDLLREKTICVHNSGIILNDIGFYGFGGARTPIGTLFEPSETEFEVGLKNGFEKVKNAKFKIQLTHMPPKDTRLDLTLTNLHVGSEAIRKFILQNNPNVAICAHIIEAKGIDRLGNTILINPGKFVEGNFGIIQINKEIKIYAKNIFEILWKK